MNSRIILLGLAVVAFGSCSTAYKTGQTPDDVYYSPARETAAYVKVENDDDRRYRSEDRYRSNDIYRSNDDYINSDDRWLRMRVRNRYRWSAFDDYQWNDWRYNSWSYNSYNSYSPFNNYWNNYYSWNSYYNPYCTRVILVNPKTNPVVYNRVRDFNLNSYSNNTYSNRNSSSIRSKVMSRGTSNPGYNNNNSTLGNSVRKVFSNSNSSSGTRDTYVSPSSSDRPTRVYQPSSSSSSSSPGTRSSGASSGGSSGSSGSSSGSGSRPSRGN
jgi:hypothetical protein